MVHNYSIVCSCRLFVTCVINRNISTLTVTRILCSKPGCPSIAATEGGETWSPAITSTFSKVMQHFLQYSTCEPRWQPDIFSELNLYDRPKKSTRLVVWIMVCYERFLAHTALRVNDNYVVIAVVQWRRNAVGGTWVLSTNFVKREGAPAEKFRTSEPPWAGSMWHIVTTTTLMHLTWITSADVNALIIYKSTA